MFFLLSRYIIITLLGLSAFSLFYIIFTPLTILVVVNLLKLFTSNVLLLEGTSTLLINSNYINIIPACIAGSAYYLLFLLNFSTPLSIKTRIKSIIFLFSAFFIINVLRIVVFALLFISDYQYFDITHRWFWYIGSTIIVVIIWFINIYLFNIRKIPIYSDISSIISEIRAKR